jgi:hypothetical protein
MWRSLLLLATAAICAVPIGGRARADVCAGLPNGTSCDNGDSCLGDTCMGGVCKNPPQCDITQFTAKGKRIVMQWHKDPAKVNRGDFCTGQAVVSWATLNGILGTGGGPPPGTSPDTAAIPVTSTSPKAPVSRRTGRARLTLRLNPLGLRLLQGAQQTAALPVIARTTMTFHSGNSTTPLTKLLNLLQRK